MQSQYNWRRNQVYTKKKHNFLKTRSCPSSLFLTIPSKSLIVQLFFLHYWNGWSRETLRIPRMQWEMWHRDAPDKTLTRITNRNNDQDNKVSSFASDFPAASESRESWSETVKPRTDWLSGNKKERDDNRHLHRDTWHSIRDSCLELWRVGNTITKQSVEMKEAGKQKESSISRERWSYRHWNTIEKDQRLIQHPASLVPPFLTQFPSLLMVLVFPASRD
jgi:hypothetical protein